MLEEKRNNGLKNDLAEDKLRWDLLPIEEIEELVDILTKGAKKYADNSWQELPNGVERYKAALMRHLVEWWKGNEIDDRVGGINVRHIAQVAVNAIFLMHLTKRNPK